MAAEGQVRARYRSEVGSAQGEGPCDMLVTPLPDGKETTHKTHRFGASEWLSCAINTPAAPCSATTNSTVRFPGENPPCQAPKPLQRRNMHRCHKQKCKGPFHF